VEALQRDPVTSETRVLAVLNKGDFFGEGALLGSRPHETSIRARTVVRLQQVGSALFSQFAGSFSPLGDLLLKAFARRSGDIWRRLPMVKPILEGESLGSLIDPLPSGLLSTEAIYADAIKTLEQSSTGRLMVVDEKQHLWGTLDRDDINQILARIAVIPLETRGDVTHRKVTDFLVANPVYVTLEDSALVAFATMLDHGIGWLPVVKSNDDLQPVGSLRSEKIVNRLIEKIAQMQSGHAAVAS
jgi:signal-transduction protein with cAMP-binding, CBS, and nucleotidyltransferase domain